MGYLFSRWHGMNRGECTAGTQKYATCAECQAEHSRGACFEQIDPGMSLARDDLMSFAFVPSDFTSPLRFSIASVVGEAFSSSHLCPPPGWSNDCLANATSNMSNASSM